MAQQYNKLCFQKIKNSTIFSEDFDQLQKNNEIIFSEKKHIAVIYAPNGSGKTSLTHVLSKAKSTTYEATYNANSITDANFFHIIYDQNSRNIIYGNAEDFLIGDNIQKEFELKSKLQKDIQAYYAACKEILSDYNITTKSSRLCEFFPTNIRSIVGDIASQRSQGLEYWKRIPALYQALEENMAPDHYTHIDDEYSPEKLLYFIREYSNINSPLCKFLSINIQKLPLLKESHKIVEYDDALKILRKYPNQQQCIVCDHHINQTKIIELKNERRNSILSKLDKELQKELLPLIDLPKQEDLFCISESLLNFLDTLDVATLENHKSKINQYGTIVAQHIQDKINNALKTTSLRKTYEQLLDIVQSKIIIDNNDLAFLQQNVTSCMDKELSFEHDNEGNIVVKLDEKQLLGEDRSKLPLSTGEQNFISLAFELLKAKKANRQITILDDPISSFDSIYRYKIVYLLLSTLGHTNNMVIFTHNTDLIRLLNIQHEGCFTLYLFNNTNGGNNGFLPINNEDKDLITYLDSLPHLIRDVDFCDNHISNNKLFLIAISPYARSYANFVGNNRAKNKLTLIMHGYNNIGINLAKTFRSLFKSDSMHFRDAILIKPRDIMELSISPDMEIVSKEKYPFLNKALTHSLIFLKLRLLVENALVSRYHIDTIKYVKLGQIIAQAYKTDHVDKRAFLMSKKSLLNEFNHFEGNFSFFQPALDISDTLLAKEQEEIEAFIKNEA